MRKRLFSERFGYKPVRENFQIEGIDDALKNRLLNKVREYYFELVPTDYQYNSYMIDQKDYKFFKRIYDEFYKLPNPPSKDIHEVYQNINSWFFRMEWYEVYDFIEFIANTYWNKKINEVFKKEVNKVLEEEMSGYRFVGDYIAPIIDEIEIKEIEDIFESKYEPVKRHLSNAIEHLSDRKNPDYINSIKESITAIEAITQIITGRKTDLANCLKELKKQKILDLNNNFTNALTLLYDWSNKEDGIRHAHTSEKLRTTFEEAKFILVTSSAFINYVITKYENSENKK